MFRQKKLIPFFGALCKESIPALEVAYNKKPRGIPEDDLLLML
jgi:hypothetical protein